MIPNTHYPIPNRQSPISNLSSPVALHTLAPGACATILRIGGAGALRRRLAEMGIVRGELIRAERVAPLGDPIAFRVKGYTLSLRRADAAQIEVLPTLCHADGTPCAVEGGDGCPLDDEAAPLPEGDEGRAHG